MLSSNGRCHGAYALSLLRVAFRESRTPLFTLLVTLGTSCIFSDLFGDKKETSHADSGKLSTTTRNQGGKVGSLGGNNSSTNENNTNNTNNTSEGAPENSSMDPTDASASTQDGGSDLIANDSSTSEDAASQGNQGNQESTTGQPTSCPAGSAFPTLKLTTVATVNAPLFVIGPQGEPDTLFVLERGGNVRVVSKGMLQPQPLLTVSPVAMDGERGALSIALHPNFAENGRMFIFYTSTDSTIEEWKRTSPTSANKIKVLYKYAHSHMYHQGGMSTFGPDGFLYFSVGDNHSGGGPSQDINARYGKIMRIDADTGMPAPGNVMNTYTWDYGFRNPFRFSFDRTTGDIYIGDVGENTMEEIDFQPKGMGGQNYGWPMSEGTNGTFGIKPVYAYGHGVGQAIIGGYVYRGKKYPCLQGRYFYGDNRSGTVRSFVVSNGKATDHRDHSGVIGAAGISSFGEDGNGELYIARLSGRVSRIETE